MRESLDGQKSNLNSVTKYVSVTKISLRKSLFYCVVFGFRRKTTLVKSRTGRRRERRSSQEKEQRKDEKHELLVRSADSSQIWQLFYHG